MMVDELILRAGRLLHTSSGQYSDYTVEGHFVALRDITRTEIKAIIQSAAELSIDDDRKFEEGEAQDKLMPLMIKAGLLLEVDSLEFHMGSYGEIDLFGLKVDRR